jgi:motility quorum-sensing regulator/GCU-specific mRNA interferase toxin
MPSWKNWADFYKSMTTHDDSKVWQDVYRPEYCSIPIYLKLTVVPEQKLAVVSFKRR